MSYPKRLLRLRPTRGLALDTPAHEVGPDFYTAAANVLFRSGFASRLPGSRSAYDTAIASAAPGDILHIVNASFGGTNYWLVFEADGTVWSITGVTADDIDGSALIAAIADPWRYSSALLNGVPIISNGSDEPVYWPGTGELVTLPDWTATESAEAIAVFKYHVFAMDISGPGGSFPNLVKWSDAAEPGTVPDSWTPAADNEAGSVELADGPGPVLCAVPLRDQLIFYKRSTMYGAQYVGGNSKYAFQKLQSASGALTRRSVCDVNGQHLVVTDGDIILTDGTNRRSIGESRHKDYLFNTLDQDNYLNLFCVYHRAKNEVLIGFPSSGSERADVGLVYDVQKDAFGIRDLPSVAHAVVGSVDDTAPSNIIDDQTDIIDTVTQSIDGSSIAAATDSLLFAAVDELLLQDTGTAVAVNASLGRHDLTFGEPERVKFVRRVHLRAKPGYGTLLVRVGGRMTPTDSIAWSPEVALTEPEQIVNTFAQGRYISWEARSIDDDVWTVTGVDIEAELRGYH